MGITELLLVAVGLSMDAFAVAICKGLGMGRMNVRAAAVIALFFGGFQALMPVIGWAVGSQFAQLVANVGHWIAFGLLAFIGAKMIWDAVRDRQEGDEPDAFRLDMAELALLAVATSIDALAVGVTFAFLQVNIAFAAPLIGITTFVLSFAGVAVGTLFGNRWERPSAIAGGVVLVAIGLKTLIDHMP